MKFKKLNEDEAWDEIKKASSSNLVTVMDKYSIEGIDVFKNVFEFLGDYSGDLGTADIAEILIHSKFPVKSTREPVIYDPVNYEIYGVTTNRLDGKWLFRTFGNRPAM